MKRGNTTQVTCAVFFRFQWSFTVDPKVIKHTNFWLLIVHFGDRRVKNRKCQLTWFMMGVRKHSWHATTVCVNKMFFAWNCYWKRFVDRTVKNQTCQLCYIWQCHKIYWVSMCIAKTNIDLWVVRASQRLFCIKFCIKIPNTVNFSLFWFLHGSLHFIVAGAMILTLSADLVNTYS